jgi:hypothetical protein
MSGKATLTTVMSSSNMNVATQTMTSVHHLRSIAGSSSRFVRKSDHPLD